MLRCADEMKKLEWLQDRENGAVIYEYVVCSMGRTLPRATDECCVFEVCLEPLGQMLRTGTEGLSVLDNSTRIHGKLHPMMAIISIGLRVPKAFSSVFSESEPMASHGLLQATVS